MAHIIIAIIGIGGNLFGNVLMSFQAINLAVADIFAAFLVFVSCVIVIGLIYLALEGQYLNKLKFIRKNRSFLKSQVVFWVIFIGVVFWLRTFLRNLGIEGATYDFFGEILNKEYRMGSGTFTIGKILLFFLAIWVSVVIAKIVRVILEEDVLERFSLKKGIPRMISVMTRYTLIVIGVFVAVSLAGMSLDNLTIILGAFSVGIGFGLQNIFNNLVSGLILLFERPIQIGDVVEVGSLVGNIKSMGIRSSNLKTFDGAEVIVPNGHLVSNEVINWTLSDKTRRIEIFAGVAYGSDVHKVKKLLLKILSDHPDIIDKPEPQVYFNDLGESSLDFRLLFWTNNFDEWLRIKSEVVFKIYDTLNEEGIEIPFPQRDIHVKSGKA
jgi:small-conductance mechanosensitive channel